MYKGPWDCMKKVVQNQGIQRGLYRGWLPVVVAR